MTIDFVVGLLRSPKLNDSIWIVIERLTKSAHFTPIRTTNLVRFRELYVDEIMRLHGAPVSIILDKDTRFMSKF